jgi:thiosulfate/3-mercaptopyruvate sulfurtransferase
MDTYRQLISCAELSARLEQSDLVILDASIPPVGGMQLPTHSWPATAIKHARRFDLNKHFSDLTSDLPHTMPSAAQFEANARALGIDKQSQVVVYDDLGLFSAARAWYMFKAMGHQNVAVLDGGLPQWLKLGCEVDSAQKKPHDSRSNLDTEMAGDFVANFDPRYFCDWVEVKQNIESNQQLVADARGAARFLGKVPEPRAGVRSGHMPNAHNLPYSELLEQSLFKSKTRLIAIFEQINPDNKPMIMTCGSGVTACVLALGAELCGNQQSKVYDGSWSEWGGVKTLPVVK